MYFIKPIIFPGLSVTGATIILTNTTEIPEVTGYKAKIRELGLRKGTLRHFC